MVKMGEPAMNSCQFNVDKKCKIKIKMKPGSSMQWRSLKDDLHLGMRWLDSLMQISDGVKGYTMGLIHYDKRGERKRGSGVYSGSNPLR